MALSLVLLVLALSTVFLFGQDRGHFYRAGHHDWLTSQHLAQAVNLSPEHHFLLFISRILDADGAPSYLTYARWPIGSYALVKLAVLPFEGDLSAQIYAARIVTLLLFAGSAVLAYLALARLTGGEGWIALAATLVAFSSWHALYYSDAFAPDAVPGLFGVMLTFHGMVLFVQEDRFRQLLVKSCAALLLCWQVYALLLPFIVLGMASELSRVRGGEGGNFAPWRSASRLVRRCVAAVLSSRYLRLGVVALCFGAAVLSFNVVNEYVAFDRQIPLTDLPTIHSMSYRFGQNDEFNAQYAEAREWGYFLGGQFYCIAMMTLPAFLSPYESPYDKWTVVEPQDSLAVIAAALVVTVCLIGLGFIRHKLLLATLLTSGFCWALLLRNHVAFHDFQSLFYIGIPLVAVSLALLYIRKRSSEQVVSTFAVAALLLFVLSSVEMAGVGHDSGDARAEHDMLKDFEVIRNMVGESVVYIDGIQTDARYGGAALASSYFLTGSFIEYEKSGFSSLIRGRRDLADYVITLDRERVPALLTPDNRRIFLYDRILYDNPYEEETLGSPIIASDWDVYFNKDGTLIYVGKECTNTDIPFFLHVVPRDANDLPEPRQQYGFDNVDFLFADYARRKGQKCVAVRNLPDYDIARISTGQYTDEGRLWEAEVSFDE